MSNWMTENVTTNEVIMEHELPLGLLRSRTYATLSPSDLEIMGKRAAAMYLGNEASLNDAVVKLASQHASMSPEQVRRVVEFANQNTFQLIFEKQAGDKNVEFEIADPGVILRDLNDGARPAAVSAAPTEYSMGTMKTSSPLDDIRLCEMFGVNLETPAMRRAGPGMLKEAMAHIRVGDDNGLVANDLARATTVDAIKEATAFSYPSESAHNRLVEMRQQLIKMAEDSDYATDMNTRLTKEAQNEFTQHVRQAVLSGGSLGEIVHALSSVPSSPVLFKRAMAEVVDDLLVHDVNIGKLQGGLAHYQIEKLATRIPNPENPILQSYAAFVKLASEQETLKHATIHTHDCLEEVDTALSQVLRSK